MPSTLKFTHIILFDKDIRYNAYLRRAWALPHNINTVILYAWMYVYIIYANVQSYCRMKDPVNVLSLVRFLSVLRARVWSFGAFLHAKQKLNSYQNLHCTIERKDSVTSSVCFGSTLAGHRLNVCFGSKLRAVRMVVSAVCFFVTVTSVDIVWMVISEWWEARRNIVWMEDRSVHKDKWQCIDSRNMVQYDIRNKGNVTYHRVLGTPCQAPTWGYEDLTIVLLYIIRNYNSDRPARPLSTITLVSHPLGENHELANSNPNHKLATTCICRTEDCSGDVITSAEYSQGLRTPTPLARLINILKNIEKYENKKTSTLKKYLLEKFFCCFCCLSWNVTLFYPITSPTLRSSLRTLFRNHSGIWYLWIKSCAVAA